MSDNPSHAERIEAIQHTLEHEEEYFYYRYEDDVGYLLERVAELEREIWEKDQYIIDLEYELDADRE